MKRPSPFTELAASFREQKTPCASGNTTFAGAPSAYGSLTIPGGRHQSSMMKQESG